MLDTGDSLVPGVLSPFDIGKLSLSRVLHSDWSISISVAWTVCQPYARNGGPLNRLKISLAEYLVNKVSKSEDK